MKKKNKNYDSIGVRFLSVGLTILFIIVAFFSVLFAQGNIIDFTGREIVSTGSIRISSNTNRVTAYLNNEKKNVNDNRIENLKTGEYSVKIESQGYTPWEGTVKVNSGIVTELNVQLFPTDLEIIEFMADEVDNFYFTNDKKYIYYFIDNSPDSQKNGLWRQTIQESVFSIIENTKLKISDLNLALQNATQGEFDFLISPDNNKILLYNKTSGLRYIISGNRFNDATDFELFRMNFDITNAEWLTSDHMLITTPTLILDYNIDTQSMNLINYFSENNLNYFKDFNKVYFYLEDSIFKYENGSTEEIDVEEIIAGSGEWPSSIQEIYGANDNFIVFFDGTNLFHLDFETMVLKNVGEYKFQNASNDLKNIIVTDTENKIVVIEIDKTRFQENYTFSIIPTSLPVGLLPNTITWSGDSSFFTYKVKDSEVLFAASRRGANIVTLLNTSESHIGDTILIEPNNSAIILILTARAEADAISKMYKINID